MYAHKSTHYIVSLIWKSDHSFSHFNKKLINHIQPMWSILTPLCLFLLTFISYEFLPLILVGKMPCTNFNKFKSLPREKKIEAQIITLLSGFFINMLIVYAISIDINQMNFLHNIPQLASLLILINVQTAYLYALPFPTNDGYDLLRVIFKYFKLPWETFSETFISKSTVVAIILFGGATIVAFDAFMVAFTMLASARSNNIIFLLLNSLLSFCL
ncbi:MAG: hypothetical protein HYS16_01455 [Deltaproteobacteria bacterium]|nr:MAG: hypothetical protein HYS16_01455 [Deltaproteobacteria bacterium]